jgi:hypothetical protein
MSTNIILPNIPSSISVTITLPRDPNSFRELNEITKGMDEIDRLLRRLAPDSWPPRTPIKQRRAILLRFRMTSPPEFEVLTNPVWLTLFVTILIGYKPAKDSIGEIMSDASSILSTIDGLTQDQIRALTIGTKLMMARILEVTEQHAIRIVKRLRLARVRILGREVGRVSIVVKELDRKP